ncbi:hypothetical protein GOP47_0027835 [Adiantum capillus-veneris]|nr:hypothetical protein GOP47_0027244 [Adiantum capillus-veneris]KAI5057820.1 hypothetical protein GOP47_0027835 [Adiantum capillus-veneris]
MRRPILQPAKSSPLSVSSQALCWPCKGFSSVSGRAPLSWQDYFPDAIEFWDCGLTQSSSNAEHQLIKESLGITRGCHAVHGIKVALEGTFFERKDGGNPLRQGQLFTSDVSHLCKTRSKDVIKPQLLREISSHLLNKAQLLGHNSREEGAIFSSDLSALDDKKTSYSTDDFICILQKCKVRRDLLLAKCVHTHIRHAGLETHRAVGNHLVPVFVECGSLPDAQAVFDKLEYRNVYSWTSLLVGYIQHGELVHAMELYEKMQEEGVSPSSFTLVALVKVCTALREMERGQKIHTHIVQRGFESDVIVGSTLIDMYSKFCSVQEAQKVFDRLLTRNVVAWSALTAAYAEFGDGQAALKCFEQMLSDGVIPNAVTFLSVLKACNSAGLIKRGQDIHSQIVDKGLEKELYVGNTLIDMYSKGGSLSDARDVFDKLLLRDVSSWNVMIQGYSMNHDNESALQLFESMRTLGVQPDAVTFSCVLSACSRANLLVKGQELFKVMREIYGIVPSADHINCMVDLLARAGHVAEAEKLVNSSPNPALDTCRALLSACKKFVRVEVGERCFYGGLSKCILDGCNATLKHQIAFI